MKPAVVLLLEESAQDLMLAKHVLSREKIFNMIYGFSDPVKALQFMQTQHVDVLMVDIGLGAMNGLDFLEQAKKLKLLEGKACIIISGIKDPEMAARADLIGVAAWIEKPLSFKKLHYVVMHVPELFMSVVRQDSSPVPAHL